MKLTDENLDYPDARMPLQEATMKAPDYIQKMIEEAKAKRAEQARAADRPADGEVG